MLVITFRSGPGQDRQLTGYTTSNICNRRGKKRRDDVDVDDEDEERKEVEPLRDERLTEVAKVFVPPLLKDL